MPMPLSLMVRVFAFLSGVMRISHFFAISGWVRLSNRALSMASAALATSSRRKMSRLEYSE